MDFKQIDSSYQDFGNFWYGYIGAAIGLTPTALKAAAAYAQGKADRVSDIASFSRVFGSWGGSYGDNPGDTALIQKGIDASINQNANGVQRIDIVDLIRTYLFGNIVKINGADALANSGYTPINPSGVNTINVKSDTGIITSYSVNVSRITSGVLTNRNLVTTTNTQTGQVSYQLQNSDGTTASGNLASNGNISFVVNGALQVYESGTYVGTFTLGGGASTLANGNVGTYSYNPTTGVITNTSNSVGGSYVSGFTSTQTSTDGINWSNSSYSFDNASAATNADQAAWEAVQEALGQTLDKTKRLAAADDRPQRPGSFVAPVADERIGGLVGEIGRNLWPQPAGKVRSALGAGLK